MRKINVGILLIVVLFSVFELTIFQKENSFQQTTKDVVPRSATAENERIVTLVSRVLDGDTIAFEGNGKEEKIRLIGIDAPESVDPRRPVQCFGAESSRRMHELLDGRTITVTTDPTQDRYDKYGRLLAYVFRDDGLFVNKAMLEEGYAYEYTYITPYKEQPAFIAAERLAHDNAAGLWASTTCNGRR